MKRVIGILVLAIFASLFAFAGGQKDDGMKKDNGSMNGGMQKDTGTMSGDMQGGMDKDKGTMSKDDGMMSKDDGMKKDDMAMISPSPDILMFPMDKGMMAMDKKPQVLSFVDLPTAERHVKDGPTVLFFAASWCPDCRAMIKSIRDGMNPLAADITLVVVDYDKYTDLKTKYGVTYQHTFVQIDAKGNKVDVWNAVDLSTINTKVVRGVM